MLPWLKLKYLSLLDMAKIHIPYLQDCRSTDLAFRVQCSLKGTYNLPPTVLILHKSKAYRTPDQLPDFRSSVADKSICLWYDAESLGEWFLMFQKIGR